MQKEKENQSLSSGGQPGSQSPAAHGDSALKCSQSDAVDHHGAVGTGLPRQDQVLQPLDPQHAAEDAQRSPTKNAGTDLMPCPVQSPPAQPQQGQQAQVYALTSAGTYIAYEQYARSHHAIYSTTGKVVLADRKARQGMMVIAHTCPVSICVTATLPWTAICLQTWSETSPESLLEMCITEYYTSRVPTSPIQAALLLVCSAAQQYAGACLKPSKTHFCHTQVENLPQERCQEAERSQEDAARAMAAEQGTDKATGESVEASGKELPAQGLLVWPVDSDESRRSKIGDVLDALPVFSLSEAALSPGEMSLGSQEACVISSSLIVVLATLSR